MTPERFKDRREAGQRLAALLSHYARERPFVAALPRGGVPIAFEVARALDAELDVIVVRKLGTPGNPELAMGAVGPQGIRVLNQDVVDAFDIDSRTLDAAEAQARQELEAREHRFRADRPFPNVAGRTVILVDNGIATGSTALAAIQVVRELRPARLVFAAPVIPPQAIERFRPIVDDLVYLMAPEHFAAVGVWYEDFTQTTDAEVVDLLERSRHGFDEEAPAGEWGAEVEIPVGDLVLEGVVHVPADATGLVLFAHGSGSSRFSPRNQSVAEALHRYGLGTLLFDLLTKDEETEDSTTRAIRFDIGLLAARLLAAARWTRVHPRLSDLAVGYFGSSTGGGAAIVADATDPGLASAVVSRGGRPDLAGDALPKARAPSLFVVGGHDTAVIGMNRDAMRRMKNEVHLQVVPGATHLFEEPGTLEEVARITAEWFVARLAPHASTLPRS